MTWSRCSPSEASCSRIRARPWRIARVTALLARSDADAARRSRPPSPTARANSRTRHSRSASACAALSTSAIARASSMSSSISASLRRYAFLARASSSWPASPASGTKRDPPDSRDMSSTALPPATRSSTWNWRPGLARRRARYCRPFESRRRVVCFSNPTDQ